MFVRNTLRNNIKTAVRIQTSNNGGKNVSKTILHRPQTVFGSTKRSYQQSSVKLNKAVVSETSNVQSTSTSSTSTSASRCRIPKEQSFTSFTAMGLTAFHNTPRTMASSSITGLVSRVQMQSRQLHDTPSISTFDISDPSVNDSLLGESIANHDLLAQEKEGSPHNQLEQTFRELLQMGKYTELIEIWENMQKKGTPVTLFTFNCAINAYGKTNNLRKALKCFEEIKSRGIVPSIISFNTMIKIACNAGDASKAFQMFEEMKAVGVTPDLITYNSLVTACKKSRQLSRAFSLLEDMKRNNIEPDIITYHSLIDACGWMKDCKRANQVFEIIQQSEHLVADEVTFTSMISVYGRCGKAEEALKFYRTMRSDPNLTPNGVTYSTVIHALARTGKMKEAEEVFEDMISSGHRAKPFVYSTLIHGYGNQGNLQRAKEVLQEYEKHFLVNKHRNQHSHKDPGIMEAWLQANVSSGDMEETVAVFHSMVNDGVGPRLYTYNSMLTLMAKNNAAIPDMVQVFARLMDTEGVAPDDMTFSVLMDTIDNQQAYDKAMDVFKICVAQDRMEHSRNSRRGRHNKQHNADNNGLKSVGSARNGSRHNWKAVSPYLATRMLQLGSESPQDIDIGHVLEIMEENAIYPQMRVLFNQKSMQQGRDSTVVLLKKMIEFNLFNQKGAYKSFVDHCLRSNALDFALVSLDLVRDAGIDIAEATYNRLLKESGKFLPLNQTIAIFDAMRMANKLNVHGYTTMIEACARRGNVTRAYDLLNEMESKNFKPNIRVYTSVLHLCATNGDVDRAVTTLRRMKDANMHAEPTVFTSLINSCGKGMQMRTAFEILDIMTEFGVAPNAITYNSLIDACLVSGDLEKALETFRTMEDISNVKPDLITYNSLIRGCGKALRLDEAFNVMDSMKMKGVMPDTNTYCSLIDACGQCGKFSLALDFLEEMRQKNLKPNLFTYRSFLHACAKNGALTVALQTLEDMRQAGTPPDEVAFHALYHAFLRNGYSDHALQVREEMARSGFDDAGLFPTESSNSSQQEFD